MAGPYSNPAIAHGFDKLADVFAPPSATQIYAAARAGSERQKAQRFSDLWANRNTMSPQEFDRANVIVGNGSISTGYYGVDTKAATDRRGQDVESGDRRYSTDSVSSTSRANNAADVKGRMDVAMVAPISEGATRIVPPDFASMYGVPQQSNGIVKLNQGQTATLLPGQAGAGSPADGGVPAPTVLQGNPKPLTTDEVAAKVLQGMPPAAQEGVATKDLKLEDVIMGNGVRKPMTAAQRLETGSSAAPKETATGQYFEYTRPGGVKGTAKHDPVSGRLVDQASGQPVPGDAQLRQISGNNTTINVGPNGETFGNPPANMAWAREPDGKTVKVDERGAPIAVKIGDSPLDTKDKLATDKAAAATAAAQSTANRQVEDVDRVLGEIAKNPGLTTGLVGGLSKVVPGTPSYGVAQMLQAIGANISVTGLNDMRKNSPTGGALGSVTEGENHMLRSLYGSLEQAQSPDDLVYNLKRYKDAQLDVVHSGPAIGKPLAGPARSYERPASNGQQTILFNTKTKTTRLAN